jgi:large subunit ribosomal protein L25
MEERVPAVVYGKGMEPVAISVGKKELVAAIAGEGGLNHLITLKGADTLDGRTVIIADISFDCLKGDPLHVDFHKISLEEKVKVKVPITLLGVAKGVKEGGMLDFLMHTVSLECLPTQIPEHIEVDITNLGIGNSFHVADLLLQDGLKVLEDPKATVVNILGRAKESGAAEAEAE